MTWIKYRLYSADRKGRSVTIRMDRIGAVEGMKPDAYDVERAWIYTLDGDFLVADSEDHIMEEIVKLMERERAWV